MKAADHVLTPEAQREMIRDAIEYAIRGDAHGERVEFADPREQVAQLLREYAACRLGSARAWSVLRSALSTADVLTAALDESLDARVALAASIRASREEAQRG